MTRTRYGSVTRIADLETRKFDVTPLDRGHWAAGDYVAGLVRGRATDLYHVETSDGRIVPVAAGDRVIGAFGDRAATLEAVGSYRDIGDDGRMHAMTSAGLIGRVTSLSPTLPIALRLTYEGHLTRSGDKLTMQDYAIQSPERRFSIPTILLLGTSMSAGKTETGKLACRLASEAGLGVIGAKLTGAGRYRDVLAFRDAGAMRIFDFVDAGLPSTIVPEETFRTAIRPLLSHIDSLAPDLLVAEAGASPLEPYNGAAAIDELGNNVVTTILCASDPYAVVGVMQAFGLEPDLVTGPATNTTAAVNLVHRLSGLPGINVIDPGHVEAFRNFLSHRIPLAGNG
jgi:hypothetical protein